MSLTGDMMIDYEMASPEEFIDFYQEAMWGELEEIIRGRKNGINKEC